MSRVFGGPCSGVACEFPGGVSVGRLRMAIFSISISDPQCPEAPTLLLLHGLEGSSDSHYIRGMAAKASTLGWRIAALNFRSCGGELNRMPRLYHSAETEDINFVACRLVSRMEGPLLIAGFSLGGKFY